jgi:hypothetical protein
MDWSTKVSRTAPKRAQLARLALCGVIAWILDQFIATVQVNAPASPAATGVDVKVLGASDQYADTEVLVGVVITGGLGAKEVIPLGSVKAEDSTSAIEGVLRDLDHQGAVGRVREFAYNSPVQVLGGWPMKSFHLSLTRFVAGGPWKVAGALPMKTSSALGHPIEPADSRVLLLPYRFELIPRCINASALGFALWAVTEVIIFFKTRWRNTRRSGDAAP